MPSTPHPTLARRLAPRGFTIVELLVVVAIIVMLLGVLLVALNVAARRAQAANSQVFLSSISQAITRFEADIGYLPPVLGRASANPSSGSQNVGSTFHPKSTCSIATNAVRSETLDRSSPPQIFRLPSTRTRSTPFSSHTARGTNGLFASTRWFRMRLR